MIHIRRQEYLLELRNHFDRLLKLASAKSAGYATDEDGFKNFNLIELLTDGGLTAEDGILTRMTDKFCRICNLLSNNPHEAQIESIDDNLDDLAVYAMILRIALNERSKEHGRNTRIRTENGTMQPNPKGS